MYDGCIFLAPPPKCITLHLYTISHHTPNYIEQYLKPKDICPFYVGKGGGYNGTKLLRSVGAPRRFCPNVALFQWRTRSPSSSMILPSPDLLSSDSWAILIGVIPSMSMGIILSRHRIMLGMYTWQCPLYTSLTCPEKSYLSGLLNSILF